MSRLSAGRPAYDDVLEGLGLLRELASFGATVIGTPPLALDLAESDIDIACHVTDAAAFAATLQSSYGSLDGFVLRHKEIRGTTAWICRFRHRGWWLEIFGQSLPLERQHGVRHFLLERRLLRLFGPAFRRRILALRHEGMKTEPAFARLLGLEGDPYEALLDLEDLSDEALMAYRPAAE